MLWNIVLIQMKTICVMETVGRKLTSVAGDTTYIPMYLRAKGRTEQ